MSRPSSAWMCVYKPPSGTVPRPIRVTRTELGPVRPSFPYPSRSFTRRSGANPTVPDAADRSPMRSASPAADRRKGRSDVGPNVLQGPVFGRFRDRCGRGIRCADGTVRPRDEGPDHWTVRGRVRIVRQRAPRGFVMDGGRMSVAGRRAWSRRPPDIAVDPPVATGLTTPAQVPGGTPTTTLLPSSVPAAGASPRPCSGRSSRCWSARSCRRPMRRTSSSQVGQATEGDRDDLNSLQVSQRLSQTYAKLAVTNSAATGGHRDARPGHHARGAAQARPRRGAPRQHAPDHHRRRRRRGPVGGHRQRLRGRAWWPSMPATATRPTTRCCGFVDTDLRADPRPRSPRPRRASPCSQELDEPTAAELAELTARESQVATLRSTFATLLQLSTTGRSAGQLSVADPATIPPGPISPRVALNVLLGAALGMVIGVGLAYARRRLDDTVRIARGARDGGRRAGPRDHRPDARRREARPDLSAGDGPVPTLARRPRASGTSGRAPSSPASTAACTRSS